MKLAAVILLLGLVSCPAKADFLNSITNGINSATNAVSSGLNTATTAVSNGVETAVNKTGQGLTTATNATANGLNVAVNKTDQFINTATSSVKDAYNVSKNAVEGFTSDVRNALAPAAESISNTADNLADSVVNVTTGTYRGVVQYGKSAIDQSSASTPAAQPSGSTNVDTTSADSILRALTSNSTGFIQVANSLLVALGQEQAAGVEKAISNLINVTASTATFPPTGPNQTVSLALAEAFVTALVTAANYSVTVDFNGTTNAVNSSQVVDIFLGGLEDAIAPCAQNVSSSTSATSGSNEYFAQIAQDCCSLVSQPLTYASALSQSNSVAEEFEDGLAMSQLLGSSPSLDLTRCLSNSTQTA